MTIDASNLLSSTNTSYASASLSNAKVANSAETDTASALVVSESSSLTEEEKLYDSDDDGVLSVTEKAAYAQAMADKQAARSVESAQDTDEKENQIIKKMQHESASRKQEIINGSGEAPVALNSPQAQMEMVTEAYNAQQNAALPVSAQFNTTS